MPKSPSCSVSSKQRVSYNKRVKVVETEHHRHFSDQEFESYWHTHGEYEVMKDEATQTIDFYNELQSASSSASTQALNESTFCLRGLEHHTDLQKGLKAHLRKQAWKSVLEEQDIQNDMGCRDSSEMLQEAYKIYSLPASRIAQQKGWNDAIQAGTTAEAQPALAVIIAKASASETETTRSPMRGQRRVQKNSIVSQAA
ncbi:MAG: hypothetical protein SGBAC_011369 [Bacillariaceae sp.]